MGISTIYQEFNLARDLTVAENIFLGHLPVKGLTVDWAGVRAHSREILETLGVTFSVDALTSTLSVAEQQLVEIAKSLNRKTRILIMDEPSAVLGEKDLEKLFQVVRSLQAQWDRHHLHLSPPEGDLRAGGPGDGAQRWALYRYPKRF